MERLSSGVLLEHSVFLKKKMYIRHHYGLIRTCPKGFSRNTACFGCTITAGRKAV